jgi:hypothetical protein
MPDSLKFACSALLFLLATGTLAQTNTTPRHLVWNSKTFVELDYKHTIRKSNDLPEAERTALVDTISAQLRPFMADLEIASETELRKVAAQSRYKFIDLNSNGIPEVIVQPVGLKAGCGATGNCPFWVFLKTADGYKVILDTRDNDGVGGIELYRIEPELHGNFHDISVATHGSASERTVLIYGFRQNYYYLIHCYSLSWSPQPGTKYRKTPSITSCEAIQ